MKSGDSSARTIGLIGLSILIHGAAYWSFNENLSLKQMARIIEETRVQANKSEVWEKISNHSKDVEVEIDVAMIADQPATPSEPKVEPKAEPKIEAKKAESKKEVIKVAKKKVTPVEVATELPQKEVIEEVKTVSLPAQTVDVEEPENLDPEIRLIPATQWAEEMAGTDGEANNKIDSKTEDTDLLSALKEKEEIEAEEETEKPQTFAQKIRSYLGLKQVEGNRPPKYPLEAREQGLQGRVLLNYFVTDDGIVQDVKIAQTSGHKILDEEAVRAVSNYRYYPGQEGWAEHPIKFSLKGLAADIPSQLGAAN